MIIVTKKQLKEFYNRMMKITEDFDVKESGEFYYDYCIESNIGKYIFRIDNEKSSIFSIFGRIIGDDEEKINDFLKQYHQKREVFTNKVNFHSSDVEQIDCSFWQFLTDFTY